jgi:chromosome segregation ATPase
MSEYTRTIHRARGGNKDKAPVPHSKSTRNLPKAGGDVGNAKSNARILVPRPSVESFRSVSSSVYSVQSKLSVSAALSKYTGCYPRERRGKSMLPRPTYNVTKTHRATNNTLHHRASDASIATTIASEWAPILPTTKPRRHDSAKSACTVGSHATVLEDRATSLKLPLEIARMSKDESFEQSRQELQVKLNVAKANFDKVNAEADEMDEENHKLNNECNRLHNKTIDLQDVVKHLEGRVKELESEVQECQKCAELQAKLAKLEQNALKSKRRIKDLSTQIIEKEKEKQLIQCKFDQAKTKINELKNASVDKRRDTSVAKIEALNKEVKTLRECNRAKEHAETNARGQIKTLKRDNAALSKQVEHLHARKQKEGLHTSLTREEANGKKYWEELGATALAKTEVLEKEARGLREQLCSVRETDTNQATKTAGGLTLQQIANANSIIEQLEQDNDTMAKQVNNLQAQLVTSKPDYDLAIIEALEEQTEGLSIQLAKAVEDINYKESLVLHYQQETERFQKQIEDDERMKSRLEAEQMLSMGIYSKSTVDATYRAPLSQSTIFPGNNLPAKVDQTLPFETPLTLSAVTAVETPLHADSTAIGYLRPVVVSIKITTSNPKHWSLMTKIRAVVSKHTPIDIEAPIPELAKEFQRQLWAVAKEYDENKAKVASIQKLLVQQCQEIERIKKRPLCLVKAHQDMNAELQAAFEQNDINMKVLQQLRAELKSLKTERREHAVIAAQQTHSRRC